eukprot:SM000087S23378  [mRNA]  locus=s87:291121:295279:- [translate_table: standard]
MAVGVEEALADRSGHKQRAGSAQMLKLHAREKKGKAVMEDPEAAGGAQQDVGAGSLSSSSGSDSGGAPTTSSRGGISRTSRKARRKDGVASRLPTVTKLEPAASSVPLPPTSAVMTSKQGQVALGGRSSSKRRAMGDNVIEDSQTAQDADSMLRRKRARQVLPIKAMSASCTAASGLLQASVPRSGSMPTKLRQPMEEHMELQTRRSQSMPAAFSSQEPWSQPDPIWRAPANPTIGASAADSALEHAPELESNESSCSRFESDCQDLMQAVAMPPWIARLIAERTHISEPHGAREKGCEEQDHDRGMPFGAASQGADTAGGASSHPAGPGTSIPMHDHIMDRKGESVASHASAGVDIHAASPHHGDGAPLASQEISQGTHTRMTGTPASWLDLLNEADWEARPHVQTKPGSHDDEEDEEHLESAKCLAAPAKASRHGLQNKLQARSLERSMDSFGNAAAAGLAFALMCQANEVPHYPSFGELLSAAILACLRLSRVKAVSSSAHVVPMKERTPIIVLGRRCPLFRISPQFHRVFPDPYLSKISSGPSARRSSFGAEHVYTKGQSPRKYHLLAFP